MREGRGYIRYFWHFPPSLQRRQLLQLLRIPHFEQLILLGAHPILYKLLRFCREGALCHSHVKENRQ